MMRFAAPTRARSISGTSLFVHVGDLPQGEPKAP